MTNAASAESSPGRVSAPVGPTEPTLNPRDDDSDQLPGAAQPGAADSDRTGGSSEPNDPGSIRQTPSEVAQLIRTGEETLKSRGAAAAYVTQDEFDRLMELVSQLTEMQSSSEELWARNSRLEDLERKVDVAIQQMRNNRNGGPGG